MECAYCRGTSYFVALGQDHMNWDLPIHISLHAVSGGPQKPRRQKYNEALPLHFTHPCLDHIGIIRYLILWY